MAILVLCHVLEHGQDHDQVDSWMDDTTPPPLPNSGDAAVSRQCRSLR